MSRETKGQKNQPSLAQLLSQEPKQLCHPNAALREQQSRVWGTVQMGQFTHSLLPAQDKKLSSNLLALNRAGIRVVTRKLTLHSSLNNHMSRIGKQLNSLCSRCREGHETPSYLFENSITLVAIKCFIFSSEEVMCNKRLDKLLKFVSCAGLCC